MVVADDYVAEGGEALFYSLVGVSSSASVFASIMSILSSIRQISKVEILNTIAKRGRGGVVLPVS